MNFFEMHYRNTSILYKAVTMALLVLLLLACDVELDERKIQDTINVMGVDGPMANATINLYKLQDYVDNYNPTTNVRSTSGLTPVATGFSDELGMLENLPMSFDSGNGPFLIEVTSNPSTVDLTTGDYPVIDTVRSIITQDQYGSDKQRFYATAFTTLVVDKLTSQNLSINKINDDGEVQKFQSVNLVLRDLDSVANEVTSLYGFGLLHKVDQNGLIKDTIDIFDTPPVFDETTSTDNSQDDAAAYRAALETFSELVDLLKQQGQDPTNPSPFLQNHNDAMRILQFRLNEGVSQSDSVSAVSILVDSLIESNLNNLSRLDGSSIQDLMTDELGSISSLIENVDPSYGSIDSIMMELLMI